MDSDGTKEMPTKRGQSEAVATVAAAAAGETKSKPATGYYADPLSPIASTPMKRPRTKPSNTKSAKAKHAATPPPAVSTPAKEQQFFSPRKLVDEYDVGDEDDSEKSSRRKKRKMMGGVGARHEDREQQQQHAVEEASGDARSTDAHADTDTVASPTSMVNNGATDEHTDGVMFSPVLKVPRALHHATEAEEDVAVASDHAETPVAVTEVQSDEVDDVRCDETNATAEENNNHEEGHGETEFNPFVFIKSLPPYKSLVPSGRATVLPEKSKNTPNVCLVLDLDETLVHCTVDDVVNPHLQFPVTFNGVDYTVNVKKRPHMDYFLKAAAKQFEVVVFTASHRSYAEKLLNLLDPQRELIKYRLYREDCLDVYGNYLKDLNVLGRDLSKVVLVDNSPHAFGYQVNNGIPIETWYEDEADDELLNLLPFLESLVNVDDVRPIVETQFQIQKLIDSLPNDII